jgi:hypothetical protein
VAHVFTDQAQVRFVNQGRRLERLSRFLLRQLLRRQPSQLVVDQRQKLLRGTGLAPFDGFQDMRNIIHRR